MKTTYTGTKIEKIYEMALFGAEFCVETTEIGIANINSLMKTLYIKTILLSRLLNVVDLPEDEVLSISDVEEFADYDYTSIDGINRLEHDFEMFKAMLDTEIDNLLRIKNDSMTRLYEEFKQSITPENLEKLNQQKDEIVAQLSDLEVSNASR